MFTGLIEEIGSVDEATIKNGSLHLKISCDKILEDVYTDASIAVNGCCLTVTGFTDQTFSATAIEETLRKTNLENLTKGSKVNLERAMKQSDRLGGHIVQGHVDTKTELVKIEPEGTGVSLTYNLPPEGDMLVVEMGSITIDGISLTVAGREKNTFRVAIIPHTWKNTNLSDSKTGHISNIEFDMTGKYISRMIQPYLNKLSER